MRALIQRVKQASVTVDGESVGVIGRGLLVLAAVGKDDTPDDRAYVTDKVLNLRIFPDTQGRFDQSVRDVGGAVLLVSQFTLYGNVRKGRRPSFTDAAPPEEAAAAFAALLADFRASGLRVETGRFQEMMDVSLVNDGPVTIWVDSADRHRRAG
ncbi:MAG: D-aminoacyl-tRNA deacylase [Dehalococcoidia bacterium]